MINICCAEGSAYS